jgi:hypothetical protein
VELDAPDPAAIRLEVLSRLVSGREGWSATADGWRLGAFELIPRSAPGLSYELWKGNRRVAALMTPRDAVAVSECLANEESLRPTSPERLFASLAIPLPTSPEQLPHP